MARAKKEGSSPRTFRLDSAMMDKLARIAARERRTVTAQLEQFIWDKIREYEKAEGEKSPGNRAPMHRAA